MEIAKKIVYSFFGTMGFSVIFNAPKKDFLYCGLIGSAGWTIYSILYGVFNFNRIWSNFPAILVVAFLSEFFARRNKRPVTIYIIPGITCFVPGYGIYNTMSYVMQNEYSLATRSLLDTILLAWLIAMAMMIASSILKMKNIIEERKRENI